MEYWRHYPLLLQSYLDYFYIILLQYFKLLLPRLNSGLICKKKVRPLRLNIPIECWEKKVTLRKKCPHSELFWSAFSRILAIHSKCSKM